MTHQRIVETQSFIFLKGVINTLATNETLILIRGIIYGIMLCCTLRVMETYICLVRDYVRGGCFFKEALVRALYWIFIGRGK